MIIFSGKWITSLRIFFQLLKADLAVLKNDFWGDFIDACVWITCDLTFCTYVMPMLGVPVWYGVFVASSIVNSLGLFDCYNVISDLVADYEGDQVILFPLTLPLPSWMVFFKVGLVRAIRTLVISLMLFPVALVILAHRFEFSVMSVPKFFLAAILAVLLAGMFGVWASSLPKNSHTVGRVTTRILLPLWVFGGLWASWKVFNSAVPWLSKLLLLNPFLHGSEVLRTAVMGQKDYLPYWWSILVILCFIVLLSAWGWYRLKKRLDFI